MTTPLHDRLHEELEQRRAKGLLRVTPEPSESAIDLSTNSYLALHGNPEVLRDAAGLLGGNLAGNLSSRIIGTESPLYGRTEKEIAEWKKTQAALLFNAGYAANVGILQALCQRSTDVFTDRLNHASIYDGIRLSGARMVRYRHNDMTDLAAKLAASTARERIIVTDTVFSMDGDRAPLADLCELGRAHDCLIMVDEAHATGIFGRRLSGLVEQCGVESAVHIRMGTLSKAVAGLGGFFAGDTLIRDYLVNHARSLIYSTALPHSVLAFDLAAIRFIRSHPELGPALIHRSDEVRCAIHSLGFDTGESSTQIIPIIVGDEDAALSLSRFLRGHGIHAPAIRPPTVPSGTSRVRLSMHAGVTEKESSALLAALAQWKGR